MFIDYGKERYIPGPIDMLCAFLFRAEMSECVCVSWGYRKERQGKGRGEIERYIREDKAMNK